MFCYNELPIKYRSCLLYLTIYPQGHVIRTTSLARRWVAEGLIATTASHGKQRVVTDEAEHHLDVLFTRGFITPVEIGPANDIKSFTLHHEVGEFITKMAGDVNFVETSQPTELAHHLSIHNRIGLQSSYSDGDSKDIVVYLPSLADSPQWKLLKVLDLEACKGLKKKHLRSICKILLLRYLSLRNTDVAELPKRIQDLQCLETLDIRQTKVRMLAKKAIVLPLLKHFLAGHKVGARIDNGTSEESVATVSMPLYIQRMRNMQILSHVHVSNSNSELAGIAQLLKLRKLGVALHGKNAKLSDLFRHIKKLDTCLCSLSIRIDQTASSENQDAGAVDALTPPHFIKSLNISGLTNGLTHLIKDLHQVSKLTLSETWLKEDDLCLLGKLGALRYLKLQHKSYIESKLAFKEEEFRCLNYLLVASCEVTKISFAAGAAPQLERIVSPCVAFHDISGLNHLSKLRKLELKDETICLDNC
jgi:Leucine-rich repeat (LRR) protein